MLRILTMVFMLLGATIAQAQPRLYDVHNVASNDVLNIRDLPDSSGNLVGTLAASATMVEVISLSDNAKWGLVNSNERSGWISMRYMTPSAVAYDPPAGLTCSGTEPFWHITFDPAHFARADWSMMGITDNPTLYDGFWSSYPSNRTTSNIAFRLSENMTGPTVSVSGIIRPEICSDGMSDRTFGYSVDVILSGQQSTYVTGCCSITSN